MTGIEIRSLDPGDLAPMADLRTLAFGGPRPELSPQTMAVPPEDTVAAYRGLRMVGTVAVQDFHQWFGGREVPCGGVAGVTVAPDQRGRGLARTMLVEAVARMQARGQVVSSLFPTTASLYRSLDWEIAGWWAQTAVAVADLPRPTGAVEWAPTTHDDAGLVAVQAACAGGRDGWVVPPTRYWQAQAARRQAAPEPSWSWIGHRDGAPVAAVVYGYKTSERGLFDLDVGLVAGVDGPALTDALAFLGANGTTADRAVTTLPVRLLARHLAEGSRTASTFDWPWMLRLVDLPGAVAARGWPSGVSVEAHLDLAGTGAAHPGAPAGRWVLRVADGAATCEPGGDGSLAVGAGDLASLYAGGVDPAALAADGRMVGADAGTLSGLRAAFAGEPTLPIFF